MMDNDEIRRKTRLREAQSLERAVSRILGSGDLLCFEDLARDAPINLPRSDGRP